MPAGGPSPPTYLAFDLGASSGRAILGALDGDRLRMEEVHRFPTPTTDEEGHLFWDVEALWKELKKGLALGLDASPGLRSLSVDSWAVDYVPLDEAGSPLHRPYRYRDPRTNGVMERAFEVLPADAIYAHTGIQFLPFNTLFQLLADGEEDVHRYLPMADFFNYRFSGKAVVEVSMASTTQLMAVGTGSGRSLGHRPGYLQPRYRQCGGRGPGHRRGLLGLHQLRHLVPPGNRAAPAPPHPRGQGGGLHA
jgi:rhamnulokinase